MHACGKSGDAVEESKAGQMKASARRLVSSILCQPASRCLQLTCLALFYDPTTLTPLLLSTAYKPPSRCLQLTCLALYGPTTLTTLVQSTAYQLPILQLTCLAIFYKPTIPTAHVQATAYQPRPANTFS